MPTYEYACQACGNHFDIFQSMKDEPLRKCPKCKKSRLKRLISGGAGLIFKGTGFYETDYKRAPASGSPDSGGESSAASKSPAKPAESKGDSKTSSETKTPAKTETPKSTESKPASGSGKK